MIESERPLAGHSDRRVRHGSLRHCSIRGSRNPEPPARPQLANHCRHRRRRIGGAESRAQIAAGNAGEGVDFVNMYGTWRDGIMNADQLAEVHALAGNQLRRAFCGLSFQPCIEGSHRRFTDRPGARATGTYRLVAEFQESESALAVVTRESALAAPYSVAARMYRYQAPVLRLRPAEQRAPGCGPRRQDRRRTQRGSRTEHRGESRNAGCPFSTESTNSNRRF